MNVLAVDPGLTCGMAVAPDTNIYMRQGIPAMRSDELQKFDFLDYADPNEWYEWFDVVVCERFTITQQTLKMSRQPHPIEVIGVLRYWANRFEIPFIEQAPAEAKTFITDERLKDIGWHKPGAEHANDAARHLALYLIKEEVIPIETFVT